MEKTMSPDERIRRAEEIYYRRKMQNVNKRSTRVNVSNKKDLGMFKKMILQIFICFMIYVIFYMIQNTNYIFSDDVVSKVNEILSYDINIKQLYEDSASYINSFMNDTQNSDELNSEQDNSITNELDNENTTTQDENIGGENVEEENVTDENLSQMEQDAKSILATKSLIIPLNGTITSRYGLRNPETPTVPKNHTGIDIAVNEGTVFIASMSGVVEMVSSERRFR